MRKALHPYVMAGVAVIGASALAVTPVIAAPPDIKIVNPEVRHTAKAFDAYRDAVEHLLENLEALLGSALARPAPTDLSLELPRDSVFGDPAGSFPSLRNSRGRDIDDPPLLLANMRARASDALEAALVDQAAGRIDLAVGQLLRESIYAVMQAFNSATMPVAQSRSGLTVALAAALDSGEPGRVLNAIVTAPAPITGRVLYGDFGIGQVLRAAASSQADMSTTHSLRGESEAVVTLDLTAGARPAVVEDRHRVDDPDVVPDADEGTNSYVMADADGEHRSDGNAHRPRLSGANSANERGGALRDGVRSGLHGIREGLRDAVKTLTGRGDDNGNNTGVSGDESP
ncbi:MAG TPA: hypothetical protein VGP27_14360 [Mycobacterium sp.]|nr:hypothetical protein [Mycobacterium sp.]